ncbi:MAG: VTT domain-containing protein [Chloroflexota bacterium]
MNQPPPARQRRQWWRRIPEQYLRLIALVTVIAVTALAFLLLNVLRLSAKESLGYPAIFLIALLGNATVILPVPSIVAVCSGGVALMPVVVGLVAGVGMALGEITGYLAGFSGSELASKSWVYRRVQPWMQRRGWVVVLAFGMIPNPFFDIVGLAAGATRIPIWQFLGAAWAGKTVMATVTAYGCALGYDFFRLLAQRAG